MFFFSVKRFLLVIPVDERIVGPGYIKSTDIAKQLPFPHLSNAVCGLPVLDPAFFFHLVEFNYERDEIPQRFLVIASGLNFVKPRSG